MKPVFIATLLFSAVPSAHAAHQIAPYVSPGVQIGYGFGQGWFFSAQVSVGILGISGTLIAPAITIGIRKYKDRTMRYADVQLSLVIAGFGFGRVWVTPGAKSEEGSGTMTGRRFKLYGGFYALGSFDIYRLAGEKPVPNLGLFLVLPVMNFSSTGYLHDCCL